MFFPFLIPFFCGGTPTPSPLSVRAYSIFDTDDPFGLTVHTVRTVHTVCTVLTVGTVCTVLNIMNSGR